MSTTQELIELLRERALDYALSREHRPLKPTSMLLDQAADRLSSLSAENAALKAQLAGVDEKALLAAHESAFTAGPLTLDVTRAAIAAYLAAVRDKG